MMNHIAWISFTPRGRELAEKLCEAMGGTAEDARREGFSLSSPLSGISLVTMASMASVCLFGGAGPRFRRCCRDLRPGNCTVSQE